MGDEIFAGDSSGGPPRPDVVRAVFEGTWARPEIARGWICLGMFAAHRRSARADADSSSEGNAAPAGEADAPDASLRLKRWEVETRRTRGDGGRRRHAKT